MRVKCASNERLVNVTCAKKQPFRPELLQFTAAKVESHSRTNESRDDRELTACSL